MLNVQAIVLAAGRSTRFADEKTKLLHEVGKQTILRRVVDNLEAAGVRDITLVVGHQKDAILKEFPGYNYVVQSEQLGTGNAVQAAEGLVRYPNTLVVFGDKPLFKPDTLRAFLAEHFKTNPIMTVSTVNHPKPENYSEGYGTVVRVKGRVIALRKIEDTIECDGGIYIFNTRWMWVNLNRLEAHDNGRGRKEYFLPDLVEIATSRGEIVGEFEIKDYREATGVNYQSHLAEVKKYLSEKDNERTSDLVEVLAQAEQASVE